MEPSTSKQVSPHAFLLSALDRGCDVNDYLESLLWLTHDDGWHRGMVSWNMSLSALNHSLSGYFIIIAKRKPGQSLSGLQVLSNYDEKPISKNYFQNTVNKLFLGRCHNLGWYLFAQCRPLYLCEWAAVLLIKKLILTPFPCLSITAFLHMIPILLPSASCILLFASLPLVSAA